MARKNPDALLLLIPLGILAGLFIMRSTPKRGSSGSYRVDSSGNLIWDGDPSAGPPPALTAAQRAAMEKSYRYRMAGGGRCFDYKERRFVANSYCS